MKLSHTERHVLLTALLRREQACDTEADRLLGTEGGERTGRMFRGYAKAAKDLRERIINECLGEITEFTFPVSSCTMCGEHLIGRNSPDKHGPGRCC